MTRVLFLIMSGEESAAKVNGGITMALRSLEAKRYEDLKILLFGPSESYITKISGEVLENFKKLISLGAVDSACVYMAEKSNVESKISELGINLLPAGERLAYFINNGYEVITF